MLTKYTLAVHHEEIVFEVYSRNFVLGAMVILNDDVGADQACQTSFICIMAAET